MLNEIRRTYQLTFRHEDDDEDTIITADILFSNDTMAVFRILSQLLCPQPVTYVLSWYGKRCWMTDPVDQVTVYFDIPLNTKDCTEELIDGDFDDDVAEELANVISLVHNTVINDPGLIEDVDDLLF